MVGIIRALFELIPIDEWDFSTTKMIPSVWPTIIATNFVNTNSVLDLAIRTLERYSQSQVHKKPLVQ